MNKSVENKIDVFQNRHLRRMLKDTLAGQKATEPQTEKYWRWPGWKTLASISHIMRKDRITSKKVY